MYFGYTSINLIIISFSFKILLKNVEKKKSSFLALPLKSIFLMYKKLSFYKLIKLKLHKISRKCVQRGKKVLKTKRKTEIFFFSMIDAFFFVVYKIDEKFSFNEKKK